MSFCLAAGEGARITLRFGGKAGPDGGAPIDAQVEVVRAVEESWQSFGKSRVTLGSTALIRLEGTSIEVILNTNRTQTFEPDVFSNLGLDPLGRGGLHRCRRPLPVEPARHRLPQDDAGDLAAGRKPARRRIDRQRGPRLISAFAGSTILACPYPSPALVEEGCSPG